MTQIIADACCNHLGNMRLIECMIKTAAEIGLDYIKFQAFKAYKLNKEYPNYNYWHSYYKNHELTIDDMEYILSCCKSNLIKPLFTVFDTNTVDILSSIGVYSVKIASPDANNWHLIDKCMLKFRDIYISTGMHTDKEIKQLRDFVKGNKNIKLLYCISNYPTAYEEIDFNKMLYFDGFSDHTTNIEASKNAIDLGMSVIERHFTLGKYLPGKDHMLSSTPDEFQKLVDYRNTLEKCKQYKTRWRN